MPRNLLAWAFYSPRRLITVVVTPVLVAILLAVLLPWGNNGKGGSTSVVEPSPDTASSSQPTPLPSELLAPATAAPQATKVVESFVRIWLAGPRTRPAKAWHARLAPYVTSELATGLRATDVDRIPDTTVAGQPEAVRVGEYLDEMSVPLADGNSVDVTVAWDGTTWRVTDIQPGDGT